MTVSPIGDIGKHPLSWLWSLLAPALGDKLKQPVGFDSIGRVEDRANVDGDTLPIFNL